MVKTNRPRHGSKAHRPFKRSKSTRPSLKNYQKTKEERIEGILGYKAGMTHVMALDTNEDSPSYGQQIQVPVTTIECPGLKTYGIRTYKETKEGLKIHSQYYAEKIDKDLKKKLQAEGGEGNKEKTKQADEISEVRLMMHTQPRKANLKKKKPEIIEIPVQGPSQENKLEKAEKLLGKEIKPKDVFEEGQYTDIIGVTKGKGTQGPVKRFGIKTQIRKAKKHIRHPGAIGGWHPARVLWTVPMSGQTGYHKRTELNKEIVKIGEDGEETTPKGGYKHYGEINNDYILVKGSVPGPKKRPILLRHAVRPPKKKETLEVKKIATNSHQGK